MLSIYDLILTPIYFIILLLWVIRWRNKHYKNSPLKKYILPAFILKSICCVLLALLMAYYYGSGDTMLYYNGSLEIWNAFKENTSYAFELIFKPIEDCSYGARQFAPLLEDPQYTSSVTNMFKISGFIGLFCFGTYLPIALFITLLSFMGSWKIFIVFVKEFPDHYKKIAITCLFAPSFIFWSTTILKDPLCIFGLGLSFYALYKIMKGKFNIYILLEFVIGAYLMLLFKSYIFYLFCVAGFSSLYIHFMTTLKTHFKILIRLSMFLIFCGAIIWAINNRSFLGEILFSEMFNTVNTIQSVQSEMGGSVYTLSNLEDVSIIGITRSYLNSLNVTLFRPYPWEITSYIVVANALETLIILLTTLYLLFKLKFFGFFKYAFQNRILNFAMIFTLLLAPLAGLVSFNFGTLVRYKAPIVPFYYTYLMLLYYKLKDKVDLGKLLIRPTRTL